VRWAKEVSRAVGGGLGGLAKSLPAGVVGRCAVLGGYSSSTSLSPASTCAMRRGGTVLLSRLGSACRGHDLRAVGYGVLRQAGSLGWKEGITGSGDQSRVRREHDSAEGSEPASIEGVGLDDEQAGTETLPRILGARRGRPQKMSRRWTSFGCAALERARPALTGHPRPGRRGGSGSERAGSW